MENAQTGLKSTESQTHYWTGLTLFRPGRIQSGMNVNTNTFRNNTCSTKHCKKQQRQAREINQKICDFVPVLCGHADNFDLHPDVTSLWSHTI